MFEPFADNNRRAGTPTRRQEIRRKALGLFGRIPEDMLVIPGTAEMTLRMREDGLDAAREALRLTEITAVAWGCLNLETSVFESDVQNMTALREGGFVIEATTLAKGQIENQMHKIIAAI
jgi:hypothetical protein